MPGLLRPLVVLLLLLLPGLLGAAAADRILGSWVSSDGKAHITVSKAEGGTYTGTIDWLGSPRDEQGKPRVDAQNPDASQRTKPIIGLRILKDLLYDSGDSWTAGWIYDPESGKSYRCQATLGKDGATLNLRGYIGISLLGRTEIWTRAPAKAP